MSLAIKSRFPPAINIVVKTIQELSNEELTAVLESVDINESQSELIEGNVMITNQFNKLPLTIRENKHSAYEILLQPYCRLFFDFDCDGYLNPDSILLNLHSAILDVFETYNYTLINDLDMVMDKSNIKEMFFKKSVVKNNNPAKTSLHIIYPHIVFKLNEMKRFVSQMKSLETYKLYTKHLDTQVYKSTGVTLRTIYSIKQNSEIDFLDIYTTPDTKLLKYSDYFITHIKSEKIMYPLLENVSETSELLAKLKQLFINNRIININDITSFTIDDTRKNQIIKIDYNTLPCSLCNIKFHKRDFYLSKSINGNKTFYYLNKNGSCSGLQTINSLICSKDKYEKLSHTDENKLFNIACDIVAEGNLRRTSLGLLQWSDQEKKWVKLPESHIGSVVLQYYHNNNLPSDIKAEITNAISRGLIVKNISDILVRNDFLDPPNNYLMTINGLFDINKLELVSNSKDYQINTVCNVKYTCPEMINQLLGDNKDLAQQLIDDLETRTKELEEVIDKIMYNDQTPKSIAERERFEKALGLLLTGNHNEIYHFCGKSNGGKSVITNLILSTFGDYGYKGSADSILQNKGKSTHEGLAFYLDKRVTIISELGKDFKISEERLKIITEDIITADKKYISQASFKNKSRTIIDSNYPLKPESIDASVKKRIQSFQFRSLFGEEHNIKKRMFLIDHEIENKVKDSYFNDAFFYLMLKWYHKYIKDKPINQQLLAKDVSTIYHYVVYDEIVNFMKEYDIDRYDDVFTYLTTTVLIDNFAAKYPYIFELKMKSDSNRELRQMINNCSPIFNESNRLNNSNDANKQNKT